MSRLPTNLVPIALRVLRAGLSIEQVANGCYIVDFRDRRIVAEKDLATALIVWEQQFPNVR